MRNPDSDNGVLLIIEIIEDGATYPESSDLHHHSAASHGDESSCMEDCCTRITKLLVDPISLAEKSPFFHDLFQNAAMESEQQCVTLSIRASEETAVMELLNYMRGGTLTEETALLDVLKLADKFQVVSCMRLCASLLTKMPMTLESALVYLSVLRADEEEEVQRLVNAAKQFVATRFVDFKVTRDEIMTMPLAVMEAILSSDSIEPDSEDTVFELARDWVKARYPDNPEDRRKIFSTRLAPHIRFSYMCPWMLKECVLTCDLLDDARKAVVDALYFQITNPIHHHHYTTAAAAADNSTGRARRRPYCDSPVKVVEFEFPCPEIVVYLDLCMLPDDDPTLCTDDFRWGPHWFHLYVVSASHKPFAIKLEKNDDALYPVRLDLEYEFAVRSERTKRFVLKSGGPLVMEASSNIYETPLLDFKAGKSLDFIDGVIYIELKLRKKKKW